MDAFQKFHRDAAIPRSDGWSLCVGPTPGVKCPTTAKVPSQLGVLEPRCADCFEINKTYHGVWNKVKTRRNRKKGKKP